MASALSDLSPGDFEFDFDDALAAADRYRLSTPGFAEIARAIFRSMFPETPYDRITTSLIKHHRNRLRRRVLLEHVRQKVQLECIGFDGRNDVGSRDEQG
ncbi:hypothetical protein Ciccas_004882 [Cichlidogyrus casuarinus]|uniref:Uncharacterized protein n=1 Tax=Cichlidogyrus casuarinus TaxID=1844966 RepID=A0ABD2QAA7_9PLAT